MSAEQVESLWSGLFDNSGEPLSGGKVYTYLAGTSTPANLWATQDKTASAGNPIVLDSYGRAVVYGEGTYKFIVDDQFDVTQYTLDNLTYGSAGSTGGGGSLLGGNSHWGGPSAGSGNNLTINPFPAITSYLQGDRFTFIASTTNTGPVTLSVNGLAAIGIKHGPAASNLGAGDIQAGNIVDVIYDATGGGRFLPTNGTDFLLHLNPSNQALLSPTKVLTAASGLNVEVNTTDGADSGYQSFGHIGVTRGAYLTLYGNEYPGYSGKAILGAGNPSSGGGLEITTVGPQPITLTTQNVPRWEIDSLGKFIPTTANNYDIGGDTRQVRDLHLSGELYKPVGSWTPTITAKAPMTVSSVTPSTGDYCRIGPFMFIRLNVTFTLSGTSNEIYFTLPMSAAAVDPVNTSFGCSVDENGTAVTNGGRWRVISAGSAIVFKPGVAAFTPGVNAAININGFYRVA